MMNSMATASMPQYGSNPAMQVRMNANTLFSKVMNQAKRAMWLRKLTGKQNKLQALANVKNDFTRNQTQGSRIMAVSIDQIVGSESRARDFDKHFRPLVNHTCDRWVGIAIAHHQGIHLPPVELVQVGDDYYVRDGHHRISVAKAFGQATIEAQIV